MTDQQKLSEIRIKANELKGRLLNPPVEVQELVESIRRLAK